MARAVDPVRQAVARLLRRVYRGEAYANLEAAEGFSRPDFDARDRHFASALLYGTLSRTVTIDWLLATVLHQPISKLDPAVLAILRMAVWQIYWSRSVPPSAAVDTSVDLAASAAGRAAGGLVNAVLRRLLREQPQVPEALPHLAAGLPEPLFRAIVSWLGREEAERMAELSFAEETVTTLRVNLRRADVLETAAALGEEGCAVLPGQYCPEALRLSRAGRTVSELLSYRQGQITVQDEAAMLVGHVCAPRAGWRIADLCAAPGGKTTHLAERTDDRATIIAIDRQPARLREVSRHAERLGLTSITCHLGDAADPYSTADVLQPGQFDLALCDVPCSGLGLLARKPEIRLRADLSRIRELLDLQAAILRRAAALLRPGGVLIYSTCTINPQENAAQVSRFLDHMSGAFEPESLTALLPPTLLAHADLADQAASGSIQLLPHRHGVDGFYIARMRRRTESAFADDNRRL